MTISEAVLISSDLARFYFKAHVQGGGYSENDWTLFSPDEMIRWNVSRWKAFAASYIRRIDEVLLRASASSPTAVVLHAGAVF